MPIFAHGLAALSYVVLAITAGYALTLGVNGLDAPVAAVAGGVIAVVGAILHQARVRSRHDRVLGGILDEMKAAQGKLQEALSGSRNEVRQLVVAFDQAARKLAGDGRDEMMAEMRMLQTLLKQISVPPALKAAGLHPPAPVTREPHEELDEAEEARVLDVIRDAIGNSRVDVYLQPVVSLPQRKTTFYETFSRLRDSGGDLIEPGDYLDVAERNGLVGSIDNNLLFRCIQLVRKSERRELKLGFFCNISPYTLNDVSFFPEFIDFMERNERLASSLIFEFAQSNLAEYDERIAHNLDRLGDMGFRFSMDQVETLDLDFQKLADRHVSFVKIGAEMLIETLADDTAAIELHRMKRQLDNAGIYLVVEKVETEQQLVELLDFGIDFGQGYLFGPPRLSRDGE